jgi:hypothetical protein
VKKPLNITTTKVIMGNPLVQPTIAAKGAERLFDGGSVGADHARAPPVVVCSDGDTHLRLHAVREKYWRPQR